LFFTADDTYIEGYFAYIEPYFYYTSSGTLVPAFILASIKARYANYKLQ
jgi:hypothetical protein